MKKRILFVDDEPRVLEGLQDLLVRHRRKWEMVFSLGGAAALDHMGQKVFDLIVTDMRMPEMDGATLLRHVKNTYPETVRIVLSGYSEMEEAMRTVQVAHQFLYKPCDADALEKAVERACDLQALIGDDNVRKMVGRVEHLPSLPATYAALTRTLADEHSGAREVARIIEQDTAMSAKVLQLANSAFFGVGRRVTKLQEAVVYLGFSTIQHLALATEIFTGRILDPRCGLSSEELQQHSVLTAAIARLILAKDYRQAEDAWAAGLLHDIGKLVLAVETPVELGEAISAAKRNGQRLHVAEQELYGTTHAEIGAYLLGVWGLPYPIVEAVANHHAPERVQHAGLDALTAVHVADALADECRSNSGGEPCDLLNADYLASLNLCDQVPKWREFAQVLATAGR